MLMCLAFFAGLIRGYSGFGFAMLLALGLMTEFPPVQAIPAALILDLVSSLPLWVSTWRMCDRSVCLRLIAGMLMAMPLGVAMLAYTPGAWLTPIVGAVCLLGGLSVVMAGPAPRGAVAPGQWAGTAGMISGLAMTLASAGGPPLMLYLLRTGLDAMVVRAVAVLFFAAASMASLIGYWWVDALGLTHLKLSASLLLPALLGGIVGQCVQRRTNPMLARPLVGGVLILMSCAVIAKSMAALFL